MRISRTIAVVAVALAAGCSGGGSSPSAPRATTSAPASGSPQPSSFGKSNASATLLVKSRSSAKRATIGGRKRNYVSAATEGMIATFVDSESPSVTQNQGFTLEPGAVATTSSPSSCGKADPTTGAYTCTLYFTLSATNSPYTATLTTYDAPQNGTSGTPVAAQGASSAVALSTDTETVSVVANEANNFSFDLHGIVEAFDASPQFIGVPASPSPNASPLTTSFQALDGDFYVIDAVDNTTSFDYGPQPSGTFGPASFPVSAIDEPACTTACVSLASPSPALADPTTESIAFSYNGGGTSGDGTASNPPYYGLIGVTGPSGYNGNVSATIGGTMYAATAYVMPFFGIVDPSNTTQRVDATDVSFTKSSDSVNLLAVQYHLPTGSKGYTIDTSSCGSIASAGTSSVLASGYGESFMLNAGSTSGTCTVTLSDGAGDSSTINVTSTAAGGANITVPCASPTRAPDARASRKTYATTPCAGASLVQFATGTDSATFAEPATPGDTVVIIINDIPSVPNPSYGQLLPFYNDYSFEYAQNVATGENVSTIASGDAGETVMWIGEFSGTSFSAISSANGDASRHSPMTPSILPNAANGLVIAALASQNGPSTPATVISGYTDYYVYGSGVALGLDTELATSPTTDTVDPVSLTFSTNADDYNVIFQIPPTSFVSTMSMEQRAVAMRWKAPTLREMIARKRRH